MTDYKGKKIFDWVKKIIDKDPDRDYPCLPDTDVDYCSGCSIIDCPFK